MKDLLYSGCFIIAMVGGVVMSSYLDVNGLRKRQDALGGSTETSTHTDKLSANKVRADISMKKDSNDTTGKPNNKSAPVLSVASSEVEIRLPTNSTQINEQFDGNSLDKNLWTTMDRPVGYRNNEEQSYSSSQAEVKDGQLVITAQRDQAGAWTSGEVNSKWAYKYGDFEVRTRLSANGPGVWPAAWLFNKVGIWPGGGEVDIYESLNADLSTYGSIHAGGINGHWQKQEGVYNIDPRNYHVYKISKQPGVISWWVDGIKRAEWDKDSLLSGQSWPFDDYTYIGLLNLAIGGNWPGPSNASTPSEVKYYIDYFTVKNAR